MTGLVLQFIANPCIALKDKKKMLVRWVAAGEDIIAKLKIEIRNIENKQNGKARASTTAVNPKIHSRQSKKAAAKRKRADP